MYKSPNPMDPLDDVKRWYAGLWPMQRVGVWLCCCVVLWGMFMWVTKP